MKNLILFVLILASCSISKAQGFVEINEFPTFTKSGATYFERLPNGIIMRNFSTQGFKTESLISYIRQEGINSYLNRTRVLLPDGRYFEFEKFIDHGALIKNDRLYSVYVEKNQLYYFEYDFALKSVVKDEKSLKKTSDILKSSNLKKGMNISLKINKVLDVIDNRVYVSLQSSSMIAYFQSDNLNEFHFIHIDNYPQLNDEQAFEQYASNNDVKDWYSLGCVNGKPIYRKKVSFMNPKIKEIDKSLFHIAIFNEEGIINDNFELDAGPIKEGSFLYQYKTGETLIGQLAASSSMYFDVYNGFFYTIAMCMNSDKTTSLITRKYNLKGKMIWVTETAIHEASVLAALKNRRTFEYNGFDQPEVYHPRKAYLYLWESPHFYNVNNHHIELTYMVSAPTGLKKSEYFSYVIDAQTGNMKDSYKRLSHISFGPYNKQMISLVNKCKLKNSDLEYPPTQSDKMFSRYYELNGGSIFWICPTQTGTQKIFKYKTEKE